MKSHRYLHLVKRVKIPHRLWHWQVADGDRPPVRARRAENGYRHDTPRATATRKRGPGGEGERHQAGRLFITPKSPTASEAIRRRWTPHQSLESWAAVHGSLPHPLAQASGTRMTGAHERETWRAMEELYDKKLVRAHGINGFRPITSTPAEDRQVAPGELIRLRRATPDEVVAYSRGRDAAEAYGPGGGQDLRGAGDEGDGSEVRQVHRPDAIRWSMQRGYLPLPKSITCRIKENSQVFTC